MTGWILERERPRRRICDGDAEAREITVSAPRPPSLGPVMTIVLPFTLSLKAATTSEPVVEASN